jgi:protein tyrosine/serine phosphatase
MSTSLRWLFAALLIALMVGGPCWYKSLQDKRLRNFHVVEAGKLYRSGQLAAAGLQQMVRRYGIKTIVCLRDADTELSRQEEDWAKGHGLNYYRIPPRPWWGSDGSVPAAKGLAVFRTVMDDPAQYPVLVHCFAGLHRTGAYCAVYRMDYGGWTNHEALTEMRTLGYQTIEDDWDLLGYLESYRPQSRRVQAQPVNRQIVPAP